MMSDKNKAEILLDGKAIEISGMGDLFTESGRENFCKLMNRWVEIFDKKEAFENYEIKEVLFPHIRNEEANTPFTVFDDSDTTKIRFFTKNATLICSCPNWYDWWRSLSISNENSKEIIEKYFRKILKNIKTSLRDFIDNSDPSKNTTDWHKTSFAYTNGNETLIFSCGFNGNQHQQKPQSLIIKMALNSAEQAITSENEIQLTNSIRSLCKNEYLSALTVVDIFCQFSEKMHSFEQHIYQESKRLRSQNIEQKITDFIHRYEAWKIENQK